MALCLLTCILDSLYLHLYFALFFQLSPFLFTVSNLLSLPFVPRCLSCHFLCPALPSSFCLSTLPSATTSLHPSNLSDSLIHPSFLPLFLLSLWQATHTSSNMQEGETERERVGGDKERESKIYKYKKGQAQLQHSVSPASLYITRPVKQIVSDV